MLSFLKKSHLQFPVNVFWEYSLFHSSFKCLWSYCLCRTCPSSGIGSETTPYVQWNKDILHECLFKNFYLIMHLLQFPTSVDVFSVCCYYLKALVHLKPFARQYHTVIYLKKKKKDKKRWHSSGILWLSLRHYSCRSPVLCCHPARLSRLFLCFCLNNQEHFLYETENLLSTCDIAESYMVAR